jgi:hypothetical protein
MAAASLSNNVEALASFIVDWTINIAQMVSNN